MSNKTYILLKDLPDSKAGDEYIWNESNKAYYKNGNVQDSYWQPEHVEPKCSWFKLKEEKIKVTGLYVGGDSHLELNKTYSFTTNIPISESVLSQNYSSIIKAIEFIINKTGVVDEYPPYSEVIKKFTKEDMRKCWAASEQKFKYDLKGYYKTFEDYVNSINQ